MPTVQSVDRALDLLLAVADEPAGLMELARRTELPVSTTSRLLGTLEARHAVARSTDGFYEMGSLLVEARDRAISIRELDAIARPHVAALADLIGEAVAVSVPRGRDSLTVFQIDTPKPVRAHDWSGVRWPLSAGGSGMVMLATWPESRVDAALEPPLRACTPLTCIDEAEIRRRLVHIGTSNVCWSFGEYVPDLTSVAAAVVSPGGIAIASVQIYGPSYRFPGRSNKSAFEAHALDLSARIAQDALDGRPR